MQPQQSLNYERIARAIRFIREHRREQPRLEEVAEHVHMSVYHFQRTFREWAGTSPKQFLQYLNVEHAKRVLQETHTSLADTAEEVGLSGTGRLHDLFVRIEGMTPGEWKNGGEHLDIRYSRAGSPFGEMLVASTDKGICWLEFADENGESFTRLRKKFPHARYTQARDERQQAVLSIFTRNWGKARTSSCKCGKLCSASLWAGWPPTATSRRTSVTRRPAGQWARRWATTPWPI